VAGKVGLSVDAALGLRKFTGTKLGNIIPILSPVTMVNRVLPLSSG